MRPARKGPENTGEHYPASNITAGFNEAGPQGAGKQDKQGKPLPGFKASMRPARKGPENPSFATRCDSKCSPPRRERSRSPDGQANPPRADWPWEIL